MQKTGKRHSNLLWFLFVAILSFSLISAKCFNDTEAGTVFADTVKTSLLSKDSVAFLEKMQQANRELTSSVLPSVVTIDVVEMREILLALVARHLDFSLEILMVKMEKKKVLESIKHKAWVLALL